MKKQWILLALLVWSFFTLKAQGNGILYTDFEPDTCVTLEEGGDIFTLDLNQDGNPDVFFSAYWHSAVGNIANMHVGNNWEFCDSDGGNPLTDTTIINNSLHWSHYSTDLAMYPERTHFAFRHQTEDGYHYGWAKIYVESLAKVCVSEMAYCTIPDYPLQWGQTEIPPQPCEIIYRDFEPDSVLILSNSGSKWIDLDGEGHPDIKMSYYTTSVGVFPSISSIYPDSINLCVVEINNDIIPNITQWYGGLSLEDVLESTHYGFRIKQGDNYLYGWFETYMRNFLWGFDRTAYCTCSDYPLRWGQTEEGTTPPIVLDLYTIGYKNENPTTRKAMLFKNNELIHSISIENKQITPYKMAYDTEGNIYWMVVYSENGATQQTEIWKNDELYVSTEGHNGVSINDLYCLGDTLFYVGNTTNGNGIKKATVWRGSDFTTHWVLGDGTHNSTILDADVDEDTNIPYLCGYIKEGLDKAVVWKASQILFTQEVTHPANYSICNSQAKEVSVHKGTVHAMGHLHLDFGSSMEYYYPCIWSISDNGTYTRREQTTSSINALCSLKDYCYFCYNSPEDERYSMCRDYSEIELLSFPYPSENETDIRNIRRGINDVYMVGKWNGQGCIWKNFGLLSQCDNCDVITDIVAIEPRAIMLNGAEWYYEILNDDGSITYQHLECVGDTLFDREGIRAKVIVRHNTHYNRDTITEVTREYVYEKDGVVFWWNPDLLEFTTLYDLTANVGEEWEIKVGSQSLTIHVDTADYYEYEGKIYRMLSVSDENDLFNGNIVYGIGHFTSFFPERLLNRGQNYYVEGLRCYWLNGDLMLKLGERDCDEVYQQYHYGLDGPDDSGFSVYPNPANTVLFVETQNFASLPDQTYRITNMMGQTILSGRVTAETQQIDVESLPAGMYFISVSGQTVKFVVK